MAAYVMHIIMDNGARMVGPIQGLLTLDSYPSLWNTVLFEKMIAAHVLNNYPALYGTLMFSITSQQLITSPYLNQMSAAHVLNQYHALYKNLRFNISQWLTAEPYLKQMTAAQVLNKYLALYGIISFKPISQQLITGTYLNEINPVYILTTYFINMYFNIIIPPINSYSKLSVPFTFLDEDLVCIFHSSHSCYIICQSLPLLFLTSTDIS